jgi:hypothetical protein
VKRTANVAGLLVVVIAGGARADGTAIDVQLGKTLEVKVGYARGWMCDDTSLLDAEVVTRGDTNYWRVTGKKLGATTCRVGTDPSAVPSYLFNLRVVPAKK